MLYPSVRTAALTAMALFVGACAKEAPEPEPMAANPCAANPCAANPCGAGMPMIDAAMVTQASNKLYTGAKATMVAEGKKLWSDTKLSGNGSISCATCHVGNYAQMQNTFAAPFPHQVAMAKDRAGLEQVNAAEMVQLCMVIPMGNQPLAWDSRELAALAAYVEDIQKGFKPGMGGSGMNPCAANPCGAMNPCAMPKNPCGAKNPCAMPKNPCGAKNPCAMPKNPCATKNPCKPMNPCAMPTNPCKPTN